MVSAIAPFIQTKFNSSVSLSRCKWSVTFSGVSVT